MQPVRNWTLPCFSRFCQFRFFLFQFSLLWLCRTLSRPIISQFEVIPYSNCPAVVLPVLFLKNVKVPKTVKVLTDTYEHMRYHVRKSAFPRVQNATRILLLLRFSTFMKKLVFKKTIIGQKHNFSGHFFYYYVKLKLSK